MGPTKAKSSETKMAYKIGKLVAVNGAVLLTGGMGGVMEEASRGASEAGGLVLAICPTYEKEDLNKYVDIPVITGMKGARNFMNILSSDIVISIGHNSAGTLSEIAHAIQLKKPTIICESTIEMQSYLKQFKGSRIKFAKDINEVEKFLVKFLKE